MLDIPASVSSVFITEQLNKRTSLPPDLRGEVLALQDIAKLMIETPDRVLPKMVESAVEICDADSGGISLLEPEPAPGVFRWHHLSGRLAAFSGSTTPRDFSPCGVTIDQSAPVLVRRPEEFYTWLRDAN